MKRVISSLILVILLALTGVNAQNNGARTNPKARSNPPFTLTLPNKESGVRFLVIGDTGTGTEKQQELAQVMLRVRQMFPFEFALMLGDNMYGSEKAADYKKKFENVYRSLLDQKDRKSTRLNSSHSQISYAVFCLKKKKHSSQSGVYLSFAYRPRNVH